MLVIDIDHFKRINDDSGHLLGDKVLCAVTRILRTKSKPQGIAARLGGEEFALLLPGAGSKAAATVAEQLREVVAKLRLKRAGRAECVGNITVSIGVSQAKAAEVIERVIERADAALYVAKRAGRNCVRVATEADTDPDAGQTITSS